MKWVAEVGSNHYVEGIDPDGHLKRALEFVDRAAQVGFQAVKFQQFKIESLFHPSALKAKPELLERRRWELPEHFNREIAARAEEQHIEFASTPFYLQAVELLEPYVAFFKVSSYQILWTEMLKEVARTGKPVVLSTGMATMDEVRRAVECLQGNGCRDLVLLHCISNYPTLYNEANLAAIDTMRRETRLPVGWSDHTCHPDVIERAIWYFDASMIEMHLDIDGFGVEYSGGHCWTPLIARDMIYSMQWPGKAYKTNAMLMYGHGRKEPTRLELAERNWRTDPSDGLRPLVEIR